MVDNPMVHAKKSFSQNFLIDPLVPQAIVDSIPLPPDSPVTVLEVGAGQGALTMPLLTRLQPTGGQLVAVEVDPACIKTLQPLCDQHPHFTLLGQNILGVWPETLTATGPIHVVGNLPYHMTGQIVFHFCGELLDPDPRWRPHLGSLTLMVQREVADRILAQPGDSALSPLSWSLQIPFEVKRVLDVKPKAFRPVPKVHSTVIQLVPRAVPLIANDELKPVAALIKAGFAQPRKILKNNFLSTFGADHPLLTQLGEDELGLRAHMVTLAQWTTWAKQYLTVHPG
jgi:16S rRNA (adenine1518-N6/adenine1519-N6)-dimethyltransferase